MNDHIETYGGDLLRVIGGMTIPGVDLLWVDPAHLMSEELHRQYRRHPLVASAAKNMGERRVMVEFNPMPPTRCQWNIRSWTAWACR